MENKKKKGVGLRVGLVIILLVVFGFFALIGFITDYLWFKELGYVSVFFKQLFTQLKIGIPTFVLVTLLSYLYFKVLKRSYYKKVESKDLDDSGKSVNLISWGMAGLFGGIVTYFAVTRLWFEALQFAHSVDFDKKDPIFGMDISFYTFKLEFISRVNVILILVLIVFIILTLVYYSILMGARKPQIFEEADQGAGATGGDPFKEEDRFDGTRTEGQRVGGGGPGGIFGMFTDAFGKFFQGNINRSPGHVKKKQLDDDNIKQLFNIASKQLIIVGVIFFLMISVHFWLKQYGLLYINTGAVHGAGFTDLTVTLWVYRVLMALGLVGAVTMVIGVQKKRVKPIITVPVIMIIVGLIGSGAGMLVQNFVVSPDEISKESKYLERNIEFTQYAYNLDNVNIKPFSAENNLTSQDIIDNEATISNIRINDYLPAEKFYNQTQAIRQYYTFKDVDVDRYMVNGKYTQTFLSAREIDEGKISGTWINKHLKYTHGYGVTLSRVDKVTASGQPDMLIDSIPPISQVDEIKITRPEVYFGELTNNYIVVGTDEDEFDYPDGNNNKYARYEGAAGIKLTLPNRVMFAIRERSLKLLVSSNINSDSKIIINRNIVTRVKRIMPYLDYDKDPYMATVDGKLYWIIDAYTTSEKFPYSESYGEGSTNYVRNSVKVVVDAYNGDTTFYIVDETDAVAATYQKIYPKLFKDQDQMPAGLKAHIRYPGTMLEIQADVYRRYHMNDVKVFYQNEDLWEVATEIYGTKKQPMTPNYYIMKLPGEKDAEFVNSIPYTPRDKNNMTALLVARNDGENYGKLVLYQLPKSKIIYGPMQIEAQIDQSTEISKEFSLWKSSGSTYSRGNMFVIPVNDSLLYVEPVYLEATNSSIPEVKRVIVAYNDQISYQPTLAAALDALFGEGSGQQSTDGGSPDTGETKGGELSQAEIIQKAQAAYENATKAQQEGDWAKYGEYMKELETLLNQLK
ncbi:MAG: UPF0182 family protein [Anaerovoracaceae bacterium]